eukprot:ctg_698.g340
MGRGGLCVADAKLTTFLLLAGNTGIALAGLLVLGVEPVGGGVVEQRLGVHRVRLAVGRHRAAGGGIGVSGGTRLWQAVHMRLQFVTGVGYRVFIGVDGPGVGGVFHDGAWRNRSLCARKSKRIRVPGTTAVIASRDRPTRSCVPDSPPAGSAEPRRMNTTTPAATDR